MSKNEMILSLMLLLVVAFLSIRHKYRQIDEKCKKF